MDYSILFVCLMGIGSVFVGLICLAVLLVVIVAVFISNNYFIRTIMVPVAEITEKAKKILQQGSGYFVHKDGQLLGIGVVSGACIDAIISVKPGMGQTVLNALCSATGCDQIYVEVATENIPAIKLYERLGFIPVEHIARWYKII